MPDNTQLMYLHEPGLLHNTRSRFNQDIIYTFTGYILVAVNPYKGGLRVVTERRGGGC